MRNKKTLKTTVLFVVFVASAFITRAQTYISDPIKYNDFIVEQQMKISEELKIFSNVLSDITKSKDDATEQLDILRNAAVKAIENVNSLDKMSPDFDLKDNAVSLFKFYKSVIDNAYLELVNEYFSEYPSEEKVKEIFKKISEEEVAYDQAFLTSQEEFAEHYNFTLE